MNTISLTKNKFAIVDDGDFDWLNQWKWHFDGRSARRLVHLGMSGGKQLQRQILMSRLILDAPEGMEVDHIDGNPLNNSRSNLRICSREENSRNRKIGKNNTSGLKGVIWDKDSTNRDRKWRAQIKANDKLINLGRFLTKEEAGLAYNEAAKRYFGNFAYFNQL